MLPLRTNLKSRSSGLRVFKNTGIIGHTIKPDYLIVEHLVFDWGAKGLSQDLTMYLWLPSNLQTLVLGLLALTNTFTGAFLWLVGFWFYLVAWLGLILG